MPFVDREDELRVLEEWWRDSKAQIALVWGRRRVGKSALLEQFGSDKPTIFHVFGGRPASVELTALAEAAAPVVDTGFRRLVDQPFTSWTDAIQTLAAAAQTPTLLVLDEFPELLRVDPVVPNEFRAVWDRVKGRTQLRVLLCGSAMRVMNDLQQQGRPLYGRLFPKLFLHPFRPHEAALMLGDLAPDERAVAWGILGGTPLYLEYWDQEASLDENLYQLFLRPGAQLLTEGELVLATEFDLQQDLSAQVLYTIAAGKTKWSEIRDAIKAKPERPLERLIELRLAERVVPVTDDPAGSRRAFYRVSDNFLAFWLKVIARHRTQIDRGLGKTILPVVRQELDAHMGWAWEEAFRWHLVRLAAEGRLGPEVVAIGPWWSGDGQLELDAVALSGRSREATLVGEAKWARTIDAGRILPELQRKAFHLPRIAPQVAYAVCAREQAHNADRFDLAVTAADIFGR